MISQKQKTRLRLNIVSMIVLPCVTAICGMVLPRYTIECYGSDVNGLIVSVLQFLNLIVFLEMGVGAAIQTALYEPLSNSNLLAVSGIVKAGRHYYGIIAKLLIVYVLMLLWMYPRLVDSTFDREFVVSIIFILSIQLFAQYYFGIVDRLLLTADQRGYISNIAQVVSTVLNTIVCVSLMLGGASIQFVKLLGAGCFALQIVLIRYYVNTRYKLQLGGNCDDSLIKQKWNVVVHHIAAIVLDSIGVIVLSVFSSLEMVSVYAVYCYIVNGIRLVIEALSSGYRALLGELWAKKEYIETTDVFDKYVWLVNTAVSILYGCVIVLSVPFVEVYTKNIVDLNYVDVSFSVWFAVAFALRMLREPYMILSFVAGHYKQTQTIYVVVTLVQLSCSIIFVRDLGLLGIAWGTLLAMGLHVLLLVVYNEKNLLFVPRKIFMKYLGVDMLTMFAIVMLGAGLSLSEFSYFAWMLMAIKCVVLAGVVSFGINYVFFRNKVKWLFVCQRG